MPEERVRNVRTTLYLPPDLVKRARHAAVDAGTSVSAEVARLLREWLKVDDDGKVELHSASKN